jgi:hypothetical protein
VIRLAQNQSDYQQKRGAFARSNEQSANELIQSARCKLVILGKIRQIEKCLGVWFADRWPHSYEVLVNFCKRKRNF